MSLKHGGWADVNFFTTHTGSNVLVGIHCLCLKVDKETQLKDAVHIKPENPAYLNAINMEESTCPKEL